LTFCIITFIIYLIANQSHTNTKDWSEKMNRKEDIEPNIDNEDWEEMKESDPNLSEQ